MNPPTNTPSGTLAELAPLADALRSGALPLPEYLDRLEEHFEEREPEVQAFLPEEGRFAVLRLQAEELIAAFPDPAARPPLFGVPVGVKDIFHVRGFDTRGGSRLPPEELAGDEGPAVRALRRAGALVLGKTVSTEFAYFGPGPTRNPVHPGHTPGGSSSGSAAAVGAGLCPLALGTQTIGSISRPAAFCGVVGFKPSYDRVPRQGVLELAASYDHVGAFTRDLAGADLVARVLCSPWQEPSPGPPKRLGVPDGAYLERASPEGQAHFEALCAAFAEAGFTLLRLDALGDIDALEQRHGQVLAAEAFAYHRRWIPRFRHLYHEKTLALVDRGREITARQLEVARRGRQQLRQRLEGLMDDHRLDLWLSPAAPGPAPAGLESTGDPIMNLPFSQAGLPTLAIPAGSGPSGLPLGLQLAGRFGADEALFAWARHLEGSLP